MAKLFQFFIFCILQLNFLFSSIAIQQANHLCPYDQSLSLLKFKNSLQIDTYMQRCRKQFGTFVSVGLSSYCSRFGLPIESKISTWNSSTDCCSWEGVTCDEFNGNVIELDLSANMIYGVIDSNSSIFQLSHLKKLNLAYNLFDGSEISNILRNLTHLSHLNLTNSGVRGNVPFDVSKLQHLVSLDLSYNSELILEPYVFKVLLQNLTRLSVLSLEQVHISSSLPNNLSSSLAVIDLSNTNLKGTFPNQLFQLPNLKQLSLHNSRFDDVVSLARAEWNTSNSLQKLELQGTYFPGSLLSTIGNLKSLTYLDLSVCKLDGTLPRSFGNLSQLSHLDLSYNHFSGQIPPEILGLEHLTYLDIGWNLDTLILPSAFNNMKSLKVLSLGGNKLTTTSVSSFLSNLTNLEAINLAYNSLYEIPRELFGLSSLEFIDLSFNQLRGPLPDSFSNLVNLKYLNLWFNNVSGRIETPTFSNLSNLEFLNLASNSLSGPIEIATLSNLVNLKTLHLSKNNFAGTLDIKFLSNFKWMDTLDLSYSGISLINGSNSTLQMVSIDFLLLAYCNIRDLDVLRSVIVQSAVYLPDNNIHGEIPEWVLSSWSNVTFIELSENYITHIGSISQLQSLRILDLRSNLLRGELPALPQSIQNLYLSNNQFHGEIKPTICYLTVLNDLDLSNNSFSGAFPHCFGMMALRILDLHMNNLKGTIPNTFSMNNLVRLNLRGNHLEGEVPPSLITCSFLQVIDLSENYLSDRFPAWLGDLPYLRVLSLRSNKFYGPVSSILPNDENFIFTPHSPPSSPPKQTGHKYAPTFAFSQLQILDLSYNRLSGNLNASLFQTFREMMNEDRSGRDYLRGSFAAEFVNGFPVVDYYDSMTIVLNGNIMEVDKILRDMSIIDLSSNHFEGEIPDSIGSLVATRHLNLSHNNFTGQIPPFLGNLSKLLSLDLSFNQLDGNIPDQLATLGFLAVMNLSYNHLTGQIPTGQQLRTFQNSSYIGNDGLCGYPLSKNCGHDNPQVVISDEEDDQEFFDGFSWQSVLMGYGVGICVGLVIGSLMLFTEKPIWLIRIVEEEANNVLYKYKARNGIYEKWFRESFVSL